MKKSLCPKSIKQRLIILCTTTALVLYLTLGAWRYLIGVPSLSHHDTKKLALLLDNPSALINKIQQSVQDNPLDDKGWYVLARLYAAQGAWANAQSAIDKAQKIDPKPNYRQFSRDLAELKTKEKLPNR